ncbi:NifB/NifX family molybdenum-iron cluster-binding protein [Acetoanaerobium sticklandii]|uniref:NifB/NifX family molybdenum-iron cluster-binding protein n=1 Tax=Acetoanaerobium sticklandii TaxID=1511 RepID=UPI003A8D5A4B
MKIAIPVDEKNIESKVCISFGRTPYYMIYDTDSKEAEFFDNEAASSPGGAGIKAAQSLVDRKIDVLLTPRCGGNAADVINGANIKMCKTQGDSIKVNLEAYEAGKLNELTEIHEGMHNHGK